MMNLQLVRALREGRSRVLAPLRNDTPLHSGLRGEGMVTGLIVNASATLILLVVAAGFLLGHLVLGGPVVPSGTPISSREGLAQSIIVMH
jgi:hypothetical protein